MTATPSTPSLIRRLAAVSAVSIMLSCGGGSAATDASALALLGLTPGGTVSGATQSVSAYLADSDGAPVADTALSFKTAGVRATAVVYTSETDADGFFFIDLPPQTYNVTAGDLEFELIVYTDGSLESGTDGILVSTDRREPPLRLVSSGNRAVNEGETASIEVRLMYRPRGTVFFDLSPGRFTGSTNSFTVSPAQLKFEPSDYDEPQTITVTSSADGKAYDRSVEVLLDARRRETVVTTYALFYDSDEPSLPGYDVTDTADAAAAAAGTRTAVLAANNVADRVAARAYREIVGGVAGPGTLGIDCNAALSGCAQQTLAAGTAMAATAGINAQDAVYDSLSNRMIFAEATLEHGRYMLSCAADLSSCATPVPLPGQANQPQYESVEVLIDPLENKLLIVISGFGLFDPPDPAFALLYRCEMDGSRCSVRSLPVGTPMQLHTILDERDRRLLVKLSLDATADVLVCNDRGANCVQRSTFSPRYGTNLVHAALDRKNNRYITARSFREVPESPSSAYRSVVSTCDRDATNCSEVVSPPMQNTDLLQEMIYVPQADRLIFTASTDPGRPGPAPGYALYSCSGDGTNCLAQLLTGSGGAISFVRSPVYSIQQRAVYAYGGEGSGKNLYRFPLTP